MPSLDDALAEVRELLLRSDLIRAVAGGRRRGCRPSVQKATLRPVVIKDGDRLQLVTDDGVRPTTVNLVPGAPARRRVDQLLAEPFGNWHVETELSTVQVRITKRGEALVHRSAPVGRSIPVGHDRPKEHLIDPGDPLYEVIGGNAAKRRQVDAFLRQLAAALPADPAGLPRPLHVVDLGCGNAYLTFAAYRYLSGLGIDVRLTGVDVRADQRERNTALAQRLGWSDRVLFVAGTIADVRVDGVDVVLALHACDTATDEALARAVRWRARWILAAPCCHKDLSRQLRRRAAPSPYALLTRQGILRERYADVLTDSVRAALLAERGYQVEVVEFVDSAHTPRNLLIRARLAGGGEHDPQLARLLDQWQLTAHLSTLLAGVEDRGPADRRDGRPVDGFGTRSG